MKPDDSTLIAYADGELDAAGAASVEQALAESSELRESVARLRASRLPYQDAFAAQKLPPLPDALRLRIEAMASAAQAQSAAAAAQAQPREQGQEQEPVPASAKVVPLPARRNRPMLWLAAAFVAGAFCAGLVQQFAAGGFGGGSGPSLAAGAAKKPWISVAADYQQLYTRDTVANLTPDPAVSAKIVGEIRSDDGIRLRVPDLSMAGMRFKAIDRLRYDGKPLVQIVYLPEHGVPVALCVMKDARPDQGIAKHEMHGMTVVAWRQNELSYALIGKPDSGDLEASRGRSPAAMSMRCSRCARRASIFSADVPFRPRVPARPMQHLPVGFPSLPDARVADTATGSFSFARPGRRCRAAAGLVRISREPRACRGCARESILAAGPIR
ncbi:anti-sigma factor family protein [Burkholderia gladioli]|uniref:anti-sigma factor family protein n=1 Tax=Burkholderia gladioli TaxID=28095 RepID=UPI001FC8168A|nr:anti-sigma factor [Burkholderia gladioli]